MFPVTDCGAPIFNITMHFFCHHGKMNDLNFCSFKINNYLAHLVLKSETKSGTSHCMLSFYRKEQC